MIVSVAVVVAFLLSSAAGARADGPDLFVTNQGNVALAAGGTASVGAFTIGAGGALAPFSDSPLTLAGGGYPYGPAVSPDDRLLYIDDQMSEVYPYTLGTGSATAGSPVSVGPGSPEPGMNLISPGGQRLYVLSPAASTVSGFAIAGNGTLTPLTGSPYPVTVPVPEGMAITPDGTHLFVEGFTSANELEAFNVAANGSLSEISASPYALGGYTNGLRITPNGDYLYASNMDETTPISIFQIHSDGTLSAVAPPTPPSGIAPFSPPEISPDGQQLYVAESNGTILGYTIGSDGTLTAQASSPYAAVPTTGGVEMWDLELTPDGKELYAVAAAGSGAADGEIATFDVGTGGALTMLPGTVDSGGTDPYQESMTISSDPGPVAAIAAAPAVAGSATSFSASGSYATDAIYGALLYSWSFGDGTVADDAGPSPTHVYASPGTYTATVTETDAAGCSAALVWTGLNSFCSADPAASASTTVTVPVATSPPSQPPPALEVTPARFGNQQIDVTTPSLQACTAQGKKLSVGVSSSAIKGSKAAQLKFSSAALYLDKGIKHTRKKTTKTRSGKRKTVTVTSYSANATTRRLPASISLSIAGLKAGTHTLTVKLSYKETEVKHHHRTTVTVTKSLKVKFKVC